MQRFQVPQFIDIEDKLLGPFTLKQFLYMLGGSAFVALLWFSSLPKILFLLLALPISGFFAALAFLKVNGQPFVKVLNNALNYYSNSRLFVWKRESKKEQRKIIQPKAPDEFRLPKLTKSHLKELSWSLDINKKLKR